MAPNKGHRGHLIENRITGNNMEGVQRGRNLVAGREYSRPSSGSCGPCVSTVGLIVGIENSNRDLSPPPPPVADLASVVSAILVQTGLANEALSKLLHWF